MKILDIAKVTAALNHFIASATESHTAAIQQMINPGDAEDFAETDTAKVLQITYSLNGNELALFRELATKIIDVSAIPIETPQLIVNPAAVAGAFLALFGTTDNSAVIDLIRMSDEPVTNPDLITIISNLNEDELSCLKEIAITMDEFVDFI